MTDLADGYPDLDWDEAVDVLCVGTGPGSLAYGILCDAAGLEVLIVESPHLDSETREFRDAMTADLGGCPPGLELALNHAEPVAAPSGRRAKLETFDGEQLRQWSARCFASPFGVLFTEVPALEAMRTAAGESITAGLIAGYQPDPHQPGPALSCWLRERAAGLFAPEEDRLGGLVVAEGRIAGVSLDTTDGPRRIGTSAGLAIAVGPAPDSWPAQPELAGVTADVAVVSRWAGRFARVELLSVPARP
jgi:hypothetical protein